MAGGQLVSVGAGRAVTGEGLASEGAPRGLAESLERSAIKHVAVRKGIGTAFVIDRAGDDDLVVVTSQGMEIVPQKAEVSHPTWSAGGRLAWSTGSAVVVRDPPTGELDKLPAPARGAAVFSPVFLSDRRIAAVVSAPPDDRVPEGEWLGDLWATHVSGRGWHRLTHFEAGADRWVTIRTRRPRGRRRFRAGQCASIVDRGAQVRAVALRGRRGVTRATARRRAVSRWSARRAARLEPPRSGPRSTPTPGRRSGSRADDRVRRRDGRSGRRGRPRPAGRGSYEPPRGDHPALAEATETRDDEIAVIVGDFPTAAEAEAVASVIGRAYPGSIVDVVDSRDAPLAIRPGVFGALLHLPDDADPSAAIAAFRATLPAYTSNSWIVTP